jgi:hypothetical protein
MLQTAPGSVGEIRRWRLFHDERQTDILKACFSAPSDGERLAALARLRVDPLHADRRGVTRCDRLGLAEAIAALEFREPCQRFWVRAVEETAQNALAA